MNSYFVNISGKIANNLNKMLDMIIYKAKIIKRLRVYGLSSKRGIQISKSRKSTLTNKKVSIGECPIKCKNCHTEFHGNYCPECGQSAKTDRLKTSAIIDNFFAGLTNISRGFGFTIINLFSRPGYMMNDFIKGKRVVFTKPFQMLFVFAAIYAFLNLLITNNSQESATQSESTKVERILKYLDEDDDKAIKEIVASNNQDSSAIEYILRRLPAKDSVKVATSLKEAVTKDNSIISQEFAKSNPVIKMLLELFFKWYKSNKAIVEITIIPFLALGVKLAFKKSKYNPKLNYTECVFINAFISCQLLFVYIIALPLNIPEDNSLLLRFLFSFWAYKEIFRNTLRTTFLKTILVGILFVLSVILIAVIPAIILWGLS